MEGSGRRITVSPRPCCGRRVFVSISLINSDKLNLYAYNVGTLPGQLAFVSSTSQVSFGMPSMEIVPLTGRPIAEKKASVYAEAALGVGVGNLQRIRAFLWIRLRDYGVLDFDAGNARRLPLVDTTWQQLAEWINKGGMVPEEIAAAATEECERMLIVITH
ncbi:hypothetical protein JHK82_043652 [Glycine max]|nr:hypothetical protein JHK86_043538 [Glycine max]KAG4957819.1 hypothetical protein JHK85_044199 [Glycine max]KAG5106682.1 hypothetical protein JHK82_043652 [Glycine max]